MYETILVPTDGSDAATAALEHAIDLATVHGGVVYLVTVVEPTGSPMTFDIGAVDDLNEAAGELVEELIDAHGTDSVDVDGTVRRGKPTEEVLTYAAEIEADLIVAGQRGGDGLRAALLGSTTDRLAHLTDVPLTIVPANESPSC
jgi:nucleotide-binding universal stress UspA family protein